MTTLIVATDGSDLAIQAACSALSLTKPADRTLIVSVVGLIDDLTPDISGLAGPTMTPRQLEAHQREAAALARAAVEATVEALRNQGSLPEHFEPKVVEGSAGPTLCNLAAETDASALIVGSRGRGGLKRALLGSVSDYVVRHAPCPVMVSRTRES